MRFASLRIFFLCLYCAILLSAGPYHGIAGLLSRIMASRVVRWISLHVFAEDHRDSGVEFGGFYLLSTVTPWSHRFRSESLDFCLLSPFADTPSTAQFKRGHVHLIVTYTAPRYKTLKIETRCIVLLLASLASSCLFFIPVSLFAIIYGVISSSCIILVPSLSVSHTTWSHPRWPIPHHHLLSPSPFLSISCFISPVSVS